MEIFQKDINDLILSTKDGYWNPPILLSCISEEVGELISEILHKEGIKKKYKSPKDNTKDIKLEIGDILFSIGCLANYYKINLDECMQKTLKKYKTRDKNRWEKKNIYVNYKNKDNNSNYNYNIKNKNTINKSNTNNTKNNITCMTKSSYDKKKSNFNYQYKNDEKNNKSSSNKKLLIKNTCKQINIDIEIDNQNTNID